MSARKITSGFRRPPALRGMAAVFLIAVYVLSGALHGFLDLDVMNPSGSVLTVESAATAKGTHAPESGLIADHHCHGCFAVSVPVPPQQSLVTFEPKIAVVYRSAAALTDAVRSLDPPPPKFLI